MHGDDRTAARGAASGRPRVLLTLADAAYPVDGGKRLRSDSVLRGLAAVADVDVAVLFTTVPEGAPLLPADVRVHDRVRLTPPPRPHVTGVPLSLARGLPVHVGSQRYDLVRAGLAPWLDRPYDLVWFGGLDHAIMLRRDVPARRTVVDCDDVETDKWRAFLDAGSGSTVERLQRRVELPLWARIQRSVASWADAVVVCSELDRDRFGRDRTVVVPNTYPAPDPVPERRPEARPDAPVLLVVANWTTDQNTDAARWAAHEILPAVRARRPGARLRLVGRGPERLADVTGVPGVEVVGPVGSVAGELATADVVLVPMRFGGGTRLKVLEAWAHRAPVVSTALGCEGTGAVDGVHLLVADDPAAIAAALERVLDDADLRARLVEAGEAHHRANFRQPAADFAIATLVNRLMS